MINGRTKIYGIIGNPVSHSLSPAMHNAAFAELDVNAVYVPFPVEDLTEALSGLKGLGIKGVSVTIPHKENVLDLLDEVDPVARKIGAVNTIAVMEHGENEHLYGTNTDWLGSNRSLVEHIDLSGCGATIVGAGGAARAIGFGLLEAGAHIEIKSRTEIRGRNLAAELDCAWQALSDSPTAGMDILINATSVGMKSNGADIPVDPEVLGSYKVVMDIVYAPLETRLLKEAKARGCTCINGLEMLLYQGVAQFELWTGLKAPVEVMRTALYQGVGAAKS